MAFVNYKIEDLIFGRFYFVEFLHEYLEEKNRSREPLIGQDNLFATKKIITLKSRDTVPLSDRDRRANVKIRKTIDSDMELD